MPDELWAVSQRFGWRVVKDRRHPQGFNSDRVEMGDGESVLCLHQERTYADGVPQQDFPVKAASRSTPWHKRARLRN